MIRTIYRKAVIYRTKSRIHARYIPTVHLRGWSPDGPRPRAGGSEACNCML
jgi:hypothetical protein